MKYKNYLFDLDGVLVDTTEIQYDSTIKAILKFCNINLTNTIESILRSTITNKKTTISCEQNIILNEQILDIYNEKKIADSKFINLIIDDEKVQLFSFLKKKNVRLL